MGAPKFVWFCIAGASALMVLGMGRRALLSLAVIIAWDVFTQARLRRERWLALVLTLLLLPALVMVSNLFQSYRTISARGVPLGNVVAETDLSSLAETRSLARQAADVRTTVSNLEIRMAMWRYNAEVIQAHWRAGDLQWGKIGLSAMALYVPSVLFPKKGVRDTETALLESFGLEAFDRPENIFATTYADFGFLSILVAPLLVVLFVTICATALKYFVDPFLRMLLMGMALFYALNMEIGFLYPVAMARSFIVIAIVYLGIRQLTRLMRGVVRTARPVSRIEERST
jgi:hypothetical protein